ncbi:hypothetical protein PISL3812_09997 [Talaromyces islandicus]|uniref:Uncharacterized protein n=1 Tax=Talaromyces islandicus TaxID=28573 RepID=A0A0U1MBD0_TALIS|nr:hypothetical protein PISL3812_09997 [Talaromyces islandicus]
MYTDIHKQAFYYPDITSHPSNLAGVVSSPFSPLNSTMSPKEKRKGRPINPQQASWPQYQQSLTYTPEYLYQRGQQEWLTLPTGYVPLPSQRSTCPNAYSLANLQPLSAQNVYPNSNISTFNQPDYHFSETPFVPSNAYPITISPSPWSAITPLYTASNQSTTTTPESESQVRVLEPRPKPQCWDHGCNGREFSTFSNLYRHTRERSEAAIKPQCSRCGAVFTRKTARNKHMGNCRGTWIRLSKTIPDKFDTN